MIKNFFSHPPVTLFLVLSFVFTGVLQIKPQVSGMAGGSVASGTSTPVGFFDGQLSVNQGVANYSVPLEVPPGINGLQPNLSLHYTSTNRNGALGVGWSVGGVGSAITRCVSKERTTSQSGGLRARKELRFDRSDKFCLDGMELHQIEGNRYGSDNAVYQTYIDSGRRIVSKGTGFNGPDYFLVYEKNGLISRYGCAENGACSTGAGGTHGLVGASGSVNYTGIARGMWALVEKRTREGDKIEYEYRNTTVDISERLPQGVPFANASGPWPNNKLTNDATQTFEIERIKYAGNEIHFRYENRSDKSFTYHYGQSSFRGGYHSGGFGYALLSKRRLSSIAMTTDGGPAKSSYHIGYWGTTFGKTIVRNIKKCIGHSTAKCLPEITFDWTFEGDFPNNTELFEEKVFAETAEGTNSTQFNGLNTNIINGDFNGDGKVDFIRQEKGEWDGGPGATNTFNVYFSQGDGTYKRRSPPGSDYQDWLRFEHGANIIPGDFNGDGMTDFIRQEKGGWDDALDNSFAIYFATKATENTGAFDVKKPGRAANGDPYQDLLRFDPGVNIIPGDFNGDGRTDFIRQEKTAWASSPQGVQIYFANDQTRIDGSFAIRSPSGKFFKDDLRGSACNIITGDFNGDGKTDFIRQEKDGWDDDVKGSVQIFFATDQTINDGSFHMVEPGRNEVGDPFQDWLRYDPGANIIPGDYNGDGKTDFIRQSRGVWTKRHSHNSFAVYFSKGNGEFEIVIPENSAAPKFAQYLMMEKEGDIEAGATLIPANLDGDSMTDFLYVQTGKWAEMDYRDNILFYFSRGDGTFTRWAPVAGNAQFRFKSFFNGSGASPFLADHNGDGYTDILRQEWGNWVADGADNNFSVWMNRTQPNVISGIFENGVKTTITYDYTTKRALNFTETKRARFQPFFVVKSVHKPSGQVPSGLLCNPDYTHYDYGTFSIDPQGRGPVGFDWTEATSCSVYGHNSSSASWLKSKTWYSQEFGLTGIPIISRTKLVDGNGEKTLSVNATSYNGLYEVKLGHDCSSLFSVSTNAYSASQAQAIAFCDEQTDCTGIVAKNCLKNGECKYQICRGNPSVSKFDDFDTYASTFVLEKKDSSSEIPAGTMPWVSRESNFGVKDDALGLAGHLTNTYYQVDAYGYPTVIVVDQPLNPPKRLAVETRREYRPLFGASPTDTEKYWLPGHETKTTVKTLSDSNGFVITDVRYTQYGDSKPWQIESIQVPSSATQSLDDPQLMLGTDFQYDAHGNVTRILQGPAAPEGKVRTGQIAYAGHSDTTGQSEARVQTFQYDASGKYLDKSCEGAGTTEICRQLQRSQTNEESTLTYVRKNHLGEDLRTVLEFDAFGRKTKTTYPSGLSTSSELTWAGGDSHPSVHLETWGIGPSGRRRLTALDRHGQTVFEKKPGFESGEIYTETHYDAHGRVSSRSLPYTSGSQPQFFTKTYNALGNVVSYVEPNGADGRSVRTNIAQSASELAVSQEYTGTTANSLTQRKDLDKFGRTVKSEDQSGAKVETFYDTVTGQVSKIEMEGSRASANWEFEYNSLGDKTVFEDPASGKTEFVYNTHGDVIQQKQKSGGSDVVVDFSYDQLGRVIRRKDNDGTTTWKYFNNSKQIESVIRINSDETYSSEMTFYYDQYDRPNRKETKIIKGDQSGQGKTFVEYLAYDNKGRVVKRTLPNDLEVDYSYNEHGNLESISTPRTLARENVRGFDKDHLALVKKLAEEHAEKLLSDAAEYSAKAQEYKEYKSLFQPSSPRTNLALNQRTIASSTGWGGDPSRAVDGNTDGNYSSGSVTHTHLAEWSWWSVYLPAGGQGVHSLKIHNRTDCCGHRLNSLTAYLLTPEGTFLKSMKLSEFAQEGAAYTAVVNTDNVGLVHVNVHNDYLSLAEVQVFEQWPHEKLNKTVDEMVKLAEQYLDWAEDASTAHEALQDQARALGEVVALADNKITYSHVLDYDNFGQLRGFMYGNGLVTSHDYDLASRMTHIATSMGFKAPIRELAFSYDDRGNTLKRSDAVASTDMNFSYDQMDRLKDVTKTDKAGVFRTTEYSYSSTGNILSVLVDGQTRQDYGYEDGNAYKLETITNPNREYNVDSFGRVTQIDYDNAGPDKALTIEWGVYGKPTLLKKEGRELRFHFDHNGNRIQKESSDGSKTYYISKDYEYTVDATGNSHTHKYFIYLEDRLIAEHTVVEDSSQRILDDHIAYLHYDNLGNVDLVTDGHGKVLARYAFEPFGNRIEEPAEVDSSEAYATNRSYSGHELLDGFDLIHMNGRVYDPVLRRFLSPDNFVQNPDAAYSYNRYSYAWNNPMKYTDPSGDAFFIPVIAVLFTAGAATGAVVAGAASGWDAEQMAIGAAFGGLMGASGGVASGMIAAGGAAAFAKGMAFAVTTGIALQTAQDASIMASQGRGYDLNDFGQSVAWGAVGGAMGTFMTSTKQVAKGALIPGARAASASSKLALNAGLRSGARGLQGARSSLQAMARSAKQSMTKASRVGSAAGRRHLKEIGFDVSRKAAAKRFLVSKLQAGRSATSSMVAQSRKQLLQVRSGIARKGRWANLKSGPKWSEYQNLLLQDALKGEEAWSAIVKMSAKEAFKGGAGLALSRLKNTQDDFFSTTRIAFMEDDDCEHYNYACY